MLSKKLRTGFATVRIVFLARWYTADSRLSPRFVVVHGNAKAFED
jgi:hypothetical protein